MQRGHLHVRTTRLTIALLVLASASANAQISTPAVGLIRGDVRSESGPVTGATVVVRSRPDGLTEYRTRTDVEGRFQIAAVPGEYILRAFAIGFASQDVLIRASAGESSHHNLLLRRRDITDIQVVTALPGSEEFDLSEPNYFLSGFDNSKRNPPTPQGVAREQIKFRVAVRYRAITLFDRDYDSGIYVAYRQNSFWHLWEESAPFFDNNYNPYAFLYYDSREYSPDAFAPSFRLFVEHESNGRDGSASRSWNRYGAGVDVGDYQTSPVFAQARAWKAFSLSGENPDLAEYAGRGELTVSFQPFVSEDYRLGSGGASARVRLGGRKFVTNLELNAFVGTRVIPTGAFADVLSRLNASLMIQYFNGSAENLLTYTENHSVIRVGLATVR